MIVEVHNKCDDFDSYRAARVKSLEWWKPIPGFSAYEASSDGQIRRAVNGRYSKGRYAAGHILKQVPGSHGYLVVNLRNDEGIQKVCTVHRLVALAFLGEPVPPRTDVAHGDGNPLNNDVTNLRWATEAENMADQIRHGTRAAGDRHGEAKLTDREVAEIRARYRAGGICMIEIAREFGVSRPLVSMIINGRHRAA